MATVYLDELTERVFPLIVAACRSAIIPSLRKKGIHVVSAGEDFGAIVTNMDVGASEIILNGLPRRGLRGLRTIHPGSFSEEDDMPALRLGATIIFQNDPCDGTGDVIKHGTSPTNLTSLLTRDALSDPFVPRGALIYDVLGEYAIISDGQEVVLGAADQNGAFRVIPTRRLDCHWQSDSPVRFNWRVAYPQEAAHDTFPLFLGEHGTLVTKVRTGGAGSQAFQFFRSVIEPEDCQSLPLFAALEPLDVIYNCQPDWKTWDTDPTQVIATALGLPRPTDIYGRPLTANAAQSTLKEMHHTRGCVFAIDETLQLRLTDVAQTFERSYGEGSLLKKNY